MTLRSLRVAFVVSVLLPGVAASQVRRTQFDGIYTDAQASRGERTYLRHCASCHGTTLEGVPQAVTFPGQPPKTPALVGDGFVDHWNGLPLSELMTRIRISMPAGSPGGLTRQQVADVVAFILRRANYPSGQVELAPNPDRSQDALFVREP